MSGKVFRAIGLMSGTSCDGVDAAYIETNGHGFVERMGAITLPYDGGFRARMLSVMGDIENEKLPDIARQLTELHAQAVDILLTQIDKSAKDIDVIGFHGQTIFHDPANRKTLQVGDGALLARLTGIDVVNDFRSADVAAGGQGAPLVPLYHAAIANAFPKPCAIVNIGGVANITFLGSNKEIIACDTGPGNALIDDAMQEMLGLPFDEHGGIAAMGIVNDDLLNAWLADAYFSHSAPKSLDRNHFRCDVSGLMPDEAIATLTEFTARGIAAVLPH
ncbi:MAG TPA: anhydro-N-acetylmuramic acid kinase, partial [Alphaproteobacteria bacterium]|nr:anhydro-N-acetylmuramic acid kinase [Alphaproteobacteria bacterium]